MSEFEINRNSSIRGFGDIRLREILGNVHFQPSRPIVSRVEERPTYDVWLRRYRYSRLLLEQADFYTFPRISAMTGISLDTLNKAGMTGSLIRSMVCPIIPSPDGYIRVTKKPLYGASREDFEIYARRHKTRAKPLN